MPWLLAGMPVNVTCENPEAHEAHMRLNGECPWCGATDEDQIDPTMVICPQCGNPDCGVHGS